MRNLLKRIKLALTLAGLRRRRKYTERQMQIAELQYFALRAELKLIDKLIVAITHDARAAAFDHSYPVDHLGI